MGPAALAQVLRPLNAAFDPTAFPDLLVGLAVADDAAVYRVSSDRAIVQTVDFFAPVLDDPYQYGAVSAANAMSHIWTGNGRRGAVRPQRRHHFPTRWRRRSYPRSFAAARTRSAKAGGVIAGGHSVYDPEPKYGLAVTGTVHPDRILTKGGARPSDRLYLTKPLGTGVLCSSLKNGTVTSAAMDEAILSMLTLNRDASRVVVEAEAHALTDITGFGLLGHADEMARASGRAAGVRGRQSSGAGRARQAIRSGVRTGGSNRNEEYSPSA